MSEPPLLSGYPFKVSYGSDDDLLHDFYLPALERSVHYDRATGFFNSTSLALAASGIARLIANGGTMRLLCGAQLSTADVEAIRKGDDLKGVVGRAMVGSLADPDDQSMKARLEALAWMVACGHLEIRVVLPRGPDRYPLSASEARDYYHPKEAVFTDAGGNKLGFSGSVNESQRGWKKNYETFLTVATFDRRQEGEEVAAAGLHVRTIEQRLDNLWAGRDNDWIALDVPRAAREKLLTYHPSRAPVRDPLEQAPQRPKPPSAPKLPEGPEVDRDRLIFRFLREAPYLPNAQLLGIETSTVNPWPHQLRVVRETVARYPESFLFCDEVGLGKTIEAGLVLRQLVISGRVRRALILTPKSVLRQWQEELYEKLVLNVPLYDGGELRDVFGHALPISGDVWNGFPLILASSQLVKRRERQGELLAAEPWDLVIVDEAHHARRREFAGDRYRPNRLLELLLGTSGRAGLKDRTRCLYLLTATPMQVHPLEVWDLLKVLGLGGRWGALDENFLKYFQELRRPFADRDWDFLLGMLRDHLDAGGSLEPDFCEVAEHELGAVDWGVVRELPRSAKRKAAISRLTSLGRNVLEEMLRRHTPLQALLWRNTRSLLRKYREKGLLDANVPVREPRPRWVRMKDDEQALYDRIEEYISDFYQKYEAERRGLGFVMTVYRRRLTSSFHAMRRSLERRLEFLHGKAVAPEGLTDDDLEEPELDLDVGETLAAADRERYIEEIDYIEDFLRELRSLGTDSKLEQLTRDLRAIFEQRETVLLFTLYTDTMDYLRDQLRQVYGSLVACYSGRGGERWDGGAWVPMSKEAVKEAFRLGEEIKILLCTESASEGLNLQTCGVLLNFDMPWNPMRVEQRIGRIDRIGQEFETVWIWNYFYEGTVEATIYRRLEDRIEWFVDVVGALQPILQQVGRSIEELAMLAGERRQRRMEHEIAELRRRIEERSVEALDLDAYADERLEQEPRETPPVTLQQLEEALVRSVVLGPLFAPHPEIAGAHQLTWGEQRHAVTFSPEVFDRYPNSMALMTYGNPLFDELLAAPGEPPGSDEPRGIGLYRYADSAPVSLFLVPTRGEQEVLASLDLVGRAAELAAEEWTEEEKRRAESLFKKTRESVRRRLARVEGNRREAERLALEEEARQVLVRTALVELAKAETSDIFACPYGFGTEVVRELSRHGKPFRGLLKITGGEQLEARATDPFLTEVQGKPAGQLDRKLKSLDHRGMEILKSHAALTGTAERGREGAMGPPERRWLALAAAEVPAAGVLPFRRLEPEQVRPFENCVPLYHSLKIAAGRFSDEQLVDEVTQGEEIREPDRYTWVQLPEHIRPRRGLFVAQVVSRSMNRRIPEGAWCVFELLPEGSRDGKVVVVRHPNIHDDELGGHYTIKVYRSEKELSADGTWRHRRLRLEPRSTDAGYAPIVFEDLEEGEVKIIAELVEVLG